MKKTICVLIMMITVLVPACATDPTPATNMPVVQEENANTSELVQADVLTTTSTPTDTPSPIPQFIARHVQFWLKLWKGLTGRGGFFPFDTCVPIYLLRPDLYKSKKLFLNVDVKKIPGKYSVAKEKYKDSAPITYCTDFINSSAKEEFLEILISNLTS